MVPRLSLLIGCLVLLGVAGGTAAHGTVTVEFESESVSIESGEQTQVGVLVRDADDGVRSFEFTVSTANEGTARITGVTVAGDPSTVNTTVWGNGTRATVTASGLDLDGPTPRIATVSLTGAMTGSETLSLSVASVLPPAGAPYLPTQTGTAEVVVSSAEQDGSYATLLGVIFVLGLLIAVALAAGRE